jgi:hypothetical protein
MEGKKLVFAADATYSGMGMATNGYLPASQYVEPVRLETTPARIYVRRAVDNFAVARGGGEAAFEDFMSRIMRQMWEAFERAQVRHIHGSSEAVVCTVLTRTSATVVVVNNGYGYTGAHPTMFLEPGMWLASHDVSASNAVLGVAVISSIVHNTSNETATITFATSIEGSGTIAVGDKLCFATSKTSTDDWFVTERNYAPLGLLDLIDPANAASSYLGLSETTTPRLQPVVRASADWGEVEFMEFAAEIAAKSNSPVTPQSHTFTCQEGVVLELAKTLVPFTQINQKGKDLEGGWTTVRVAGHDFVTDSYHIPDVVYALCMEDAFVCPLDGDERVWDGDGSEFRRLANFDGKEWFARHYVQRFLNRRNRSGAMTGVVNPNKDRYSAQPLSA